VVEEHVGGVHVLAVLRTSGDGVEHERSTAERVGTGEDNSERVEPGSKRGKGRAEEKRVITVCLAAKCFESRKSGGDDVVTGYLEAGEDGGDDSRRSSPIPCARREWRTWRSSRWPQVTSAASMAFACLSEAAASFWWGKIRRGGEKMQRRWQTREKRRSI
jgi:hypothetical protein